MPRFRTAVLNTTFYLYKRDEETGEIVGPCGTGVFISDASNKKTGLNHGYAVTALHVIQSGASIIRLNLFTMEPDETGNSLSTRYLEFEPHEWVFDAHGDDIAAIDVTESFFATDAVNGVPASDCMTLKTLPDLKITMGEDVFMVGLFSGNPGTAYNQVATRFGNIAQLADFRHPVEQGHGQKRASHVIDMHSRPGFSGSPVFVYRVPGNDLTAIDPEGNFIEDLGEPNSAFVKLLGIHSGQFQETTKDGTKIPSSMTVVVPAWSIINLLNQRVFAQMREDREAKMIDSGQAVIPEVIVPGPATDNPSHKEDFTRLLGAAVKAKPQA